MPKSFLQPLDRAALTLIMVLTLVLVLMVSSGQHAAPTVRDFSWQDKQVGTEDKKFILTFSRPMDRASVEANLKIEPSLRGKFAWAGRRMAYTLIDPPVYDTPYKVQLQGAAESYKGEAGKGKVMKPFAGSFRTRDRAFAYIGIDGEEKGRLIVYNLTQQQKTVLTAKELVVEDFRVFPDGDKILFSASDLQSISKGLQEQKLYAVTTGIHHRKPEDEEAANQSLPFSIFGDRTSQQPPGRTNLVLDTKEYRNLKFELSADGQTIVVGRINRNNPADFRLWLLKNQGDRDGKMSLQPLENQPGGDFLIAPDNENVAIAQGQGVAILPMQPKANPVDFLAQYQVVLGFAQDNSVSAMVKFNTNYTRSLYIVPNQAVKPGVEKKLLDTNGSILACEFDRGATTLYCLLTQLLPGQEYQEQPYLAAIDINTAQIKPLLVLPNQRDIQMSLSPDNLALLFDQIVSSPDQTGLESLRTNEGQAIATSRLWLLPLVPSTPEQSNSQMQQPIELPLPGLHPQWLP